MPRALGRRGWRITLLRAAHTILVGCTLLLLGLRLGDVVSFRAVLVAYAFSVICVMATGVVFSFAMRGAPELQIALQYDEEDLDSVDVVQIPDTAEANNDLARQYEEEDEATSSRGRTAAKGRIVRMEDLNSIVVVTLWAFNSSSINSLILSAYVFMHLVAQSFPLPLQIGYISGSMLVALAIAIGLAESDRRRRVVSVLTRLFGGSWTLAALVAVVAALTSYFSVVTFILVDRDTIEFAQTTASADVDAIMSFYIWYFFDHVPVLNVTETLRWKAPLNYDDSWVGCLVLLYFIAVVVPIIGSVKVYWQQRKMVRSALV